MEVCWGMKMLLLLEPSIYAQDLDAFKCTFPLSLSLSLYIYIYIYKILFLNETSFIMIRSFV